MDGLTTILISVAAAVTALSGVTVAVLKLFSDTKKYYEEIPKNIRKESNINVEISQILEELKEVLNADRVQIFDFHNGGHYANGRSALKTSCTYEVLRSGIKSKQSHLQGVPLGCIPNFVNHLLTRNVLHAKSIDSIKEDMPATYSLKKSQGLKSFYDIVLNNKNGEPVGFLSIQYVTNSYDINSDQDNYAILKAKIVIEERLNILINNQSKTSFLKKVIDKWASL